MKKTYLFNWMLVALLSLTFFACDNEPLEGEFITDDEGSEGQVQFTALVDGVPFGATSATGLLADGTLFLSGVSATGDVVSIVVQSAGECTYNLGNVSNPAQFLLNGDVTNPYVSFSGIGGSGTITVSAFDATTSSVTGTFSFIGAREVTDGNGDTTTETVAVTQGVFSNITYELQSGANEAIECDTDEGGGGDDPTEPDDTFFANVDGLEFVDITIETVESTIGGEPMINITATNSVGAKIRIDVPQGLGVGTYTFPPVSDPISDGTQLYAYFNDGLGGENLTSAPESGTITFTQFGTVTGKLEATFSFTGEDPLGVDPSVVAVTEGSFAVDYVDNSGGVTETFTADVDGLTYTPESIEVTQSPAGENDVITISTANATTNQGLNISFPKDIVPGTYTMSQGISDGTEVVGLYNPDVGVAGVFASSPGTLTVISYETANGIIEATFSFTATDPLGLDDTIYEITNGQFVVNID